ncbi:hypothetical protein PISL3812_06470 [Talaromyces islandicus]|uniref:F-box domain-containing protein n=1 Tax=Talaromyces islandicus TaxID=28573 RepID=A0A0U1M1P2_TALIS|nr:hypothetical protein PISL3812_06470 [Talaromyces islandicus]
MAQETSFALITGCSSGIGKELAIAFAAKGVTVLATARRTESLKELTSQHHNIEAFALDLDDLTTIDSLKEAVEKRTDGRLDYLVNNAGTHYAATCMDLEISEVSKLFQVNVFAVMRLCQIFVPLLRRSPRARIVQIGSVTRAVPVVWQGVYNASKAALSQFSKTMRLELEPFGIEVVEVVAGFVRSNLLHHGLVAPSESLYLPIKSTVEDAKLKGNENGMPAEEFAKSVVDQVTRRRTSMEIWQGKLAWPLRILTSYFPLWIVPTVFTMNPYKFGAVHQTHLGSLNEKHLAVVKLARGGQEKAFILRLPTEVLFEIFKYIRKVGSVSGGKYTVMKRLALVCRRFNDIVLLLFYHDVIVSVRGQSNVSLKKLHAVLRDKPWIREYCRILDLSLAYEGPVTKDTISMVDTLFSYLTNLRTLKIACGPKQFPHDTVEMIQIATQHMYQIETLIFNHHCYTSFSQEILKHVSFPSLRPLEIEGLWRRKARFRHTSIPEPKMHRTGTFTSLIVHSYEENPEELKQLIQWPASLVHFQLFKFCNQNYMDLPILGQWLSIHKKTLKTMQIGCLSKESRGILFDLSKFAKLEALLLSWDQLRKWRPQDEDEDADEGAAEYEDEDGDEDEMEDEGFEEFGFSEEDADSLLGPNLRIFAVAFSAIPRTLYAGSTLEKQKSTGLESSPKPQ